MTREEAKCAASTLEDVFTPEGDAVTIERLNRTTAVVTGRLHYQDVFKLTELEHSPSVCPRMKTK